MEADLRMNATNFDKLNFGQEFRKGGSSLQKNKSLFAQNGSALVHKPSTISMSSDLVKNSLERLVLRRRTCNLGEVEYTIHCLNKRFKLQEWSKSFLLDLHNFQIGQPLQG